MGMPTLKDKKKIKVSKPKLVSIKLWLGGKKKIRKKKKDYGKKKKK